MKRLLLFAAFTLAASVPSFGQSLEDLNIQIHGYATQGLLYTTQNNVLTTESSNGSPAWTEAVVNLTAQPEPKLRVGVQARYFVLGNFGNQITLDWASADYKVNEKLGVRFGKVKTPAGLFNEIQDIDPSYLWSLLPQSVYPITSRNSLLSHLGGVGYGAVKMGAAGKLEYRGWAGQRTIAADDGYTLEQREAGVNEPNGISFVTYGGTVRWLTSVRGLLFGMSEAKNPTASALITAGGGALSGTETIHTIKQPFYFGKFERDKVMIAGEYSRLPVTGSIAFNLLPTAPISVDQRQWYGMASYKFTDKLNVGLYQSEVVDRKAPLGPARYSKDWAVSGRYDFSGFIYAKAEQHFIDGTALGYDTQMNPNGLKPDTRLTVLKVGVNF